MKLAALFLLLLEGCSTFSFLASREAAAGCQIADSLSTAYCLRNPNCYETNAFGGGSRAQNQLYLQKIALAGFILFVPHYEEAPAPMRAAVTLLGCAPVPGNVRIGRE